MTTATQPIVRADHKRMFYSAWSVRRMQANKKGQTRRLVDMTDIHFIGGAGDDRDDPSMWGFEDENGYIWALADSRFTDKVIPSPYQQGHTYLVAEPLVRSTMPDDQGNNDRKCALYEADRESVGKWILGPGMEREWEWQPKKLAARYCRKALCRYAVRIEDVRVERLQEISPEDAEAEGVQPVNPPNKYEEPGEYSQRMIYAFKAKWDEIHGDGAWESNSWVFVYSLSPLIEID